MPFIYTPAGSSLCLGDDNLNVSTGNSSNSSCSGRERRSQASAQFIELSITAGREHRSGSGEAVGSPGCASQNCMTLLQYQFDRACGLVMLGSGGTGVGAALWGMEMGRGAHSGIKPSGFGQINQLLCIFGRQICRQGRFGWL